MRSEAGRVSFTLIVIVLILAGVAWWTLAPSRVPTWLRRLVSGEARAPTLYKWRDAKGALHVTDTPPNDRPYETVRYDPDTNAMPSGTPKP
jgi:hypothetical protein